MRPSELYDVIPPLYSKINFNFFYVVSLVFGELALWAKQSIKGTLCLVIGDIFYKSICPLEFA